MTQLAIDLASEPSYRPEDYALTDCNRLAYEWVMRWPDWQGPALWLCGPQASGKTHLVHLWAARAGARVITPGSLNREAPDLFAERAALAVDGGWNALDETALFHLLNYTKEAGKWLLLAHLLPPAEAAIALPDLSSRLKALPVASLEQPDDLMLHMVMMKQLADRQLSVEPEVITYLLSHIERSFAAAKQTVQLLDEAALQQKRRITLPFARELLTKA